MMNSIESYAFLLYCYQEIVVDDKDLTWSVKSKVYLLGYA